MPELPEVTTTVNGLKIALKGLSFLSVWTDLDKENPIKQFKGTIKDRSFFKKFKKNTEDQKILSVERRAKNILINLSNEETILIHLKMTGHIIVGHYIFNKKENKWKASGAKHQHLGWFSSEEEAHNERIKSLSHIIVSKTLERWNGYPKEESGGQ